MAEPDIAHLNDLAHRAAHSASPPPVTTIRRRGTVRTVRSMTGCPGVAALNPTGAQIAQSRRTPSGYLGGLPPGRAAANLTLPIDQSASAVIEALAVNATDGSACVPYSGLLVTAPDDTLSTHVPWPSDGCSDLQIHPVVAGSTG
jgi:hypothetical protein